MRNPRTKYKRSKNVFAVKYIALIIGRDWPRLLQPLAQSLIKSTGTLADPRNNLYSLTGKSISKNYFTYRSVQYLKSCSGDFILQNLILRTRLCGTGFIPQLSCVFDFRQKSVTPSTQSNLLFPILICFFLVPKEIPLRKPI